VRRFPIAILAAVSGLGVLSACGPNGGSGEGTHPNTAGSAVFATLPTGNGGPSGTHYNLNIIGVPKAKSADMTNTDGHTIFVPLDGTTKILLSEGSTFQVLNANGTSGSAAFQLPNPDPTNSGTTTYSVFARALGKPGGSSSLVTTAVDPTTGETLVSTQQLVSVRSKGGSQFTNVSQQLLYIYALINGTLTRVPLFDAQFQDFTWNYTNTELKLLQLRFYPISTTVQ
jgi:hypothetical protein